MNRSEFMFTLAQLLVDLPFEERSEALKFYNSYFDDAGPENEQHIIEELKSPQAVAQSIREGLGGSMDGGEYREDGFHETFKSQFEKVNDVFVNPQAHSKSENSTAYDQTNNGYYDYARTTSDEHVKHKMGTGKMIALVLIIICALPVLMGIGGGIIGVVFGLLGGLIGVIAGIFGGAVAGIFGGIGGIASGIFRCFSAPAEGLASIAAGFFSLGGGILLLMLLVWICSFVLPRLIRWIKKTYKRIFGRRKNA